MANESINRAPAIPPPVPKPPGSQSAACAVRPGVAVLFAYLLLTCLALWKVLESPLTNVVGVSHLHVWEELWHFWWTRTALATGQSPFFTTLLGFPSGMNVFYDMSSISLPMVSVPLQHLLGVVGAYNAIALIVLTAAAFGCYRVCRKVSGKPLPSFIGGIIFGYSPFLQTELSNGMMENLFAFAFLPYFVLCLLRINARARWQDGIAAGLIAGFAALSSWYFLVISAFLSALFLCPALWASTATQPGCDPESHGPDNTRPEKPGRWAPRRRPVTAYAVMAAVTAVIVIGPLTALTEGPTLQRGVPWKDCVRGPLMQKSCIDIMKLFTHGSAVSAEPSETASGDDPPELLPFGVYIGKITLLLAILALIIPKSRQQERHATTPVSDGASHTALWKAGFLVFLLLMLGPYLNIGGRVDWGPVRFPLPDRLLLLLPGTGRVLALHNYRFASCVMLFGAVLATFSFDRILQSMTKRPRIVLTAVTAWLILVDFGSSTLREHLLFLPASDAALPRVYDAIAGEPYGALFNIPVSSGAHARPDVRGVQMFHQIAHQRPIPCDPIYILDPPENETSLARAARAMTRRQQWKIDDPTLLDDLENLRLQGFPYLAVHRNFLSESDAARITQMLRRHLDEPLAESDGIEIYSLR